MSKYTTELRFIAETEAGYTESQPFSMIDTVMAAARPKIFSFDYPIFNEDYRPTLEFKILRHFWTCEIGEETYGLWKLRLQTKLNEIMPYYNKMYEADQKDFEILYDTDYYEKRDGTSHLEGSGEDHTDSQAGGEDVRAKTGKDTIEASGTDEMSADDWQLYNDTPQGGLSGIKSQNYLTTATNTTADHKTDTSNDQTTTYDSQDTNTYGRTDKTDRTNSVDNLTTDDYLVHVYGRHAAAPDLLRKYREALINIDMMIINDLEPLFMGLW